MNRVAIVAAACAAACGAAPAEAAIIIDTTIEGNLSSYPGCVPSQPTIACVNPTVTRAAYAVRLVLPDGTRSFAFSDRGGPFQLYELGGVITPISSTSALVTNLSLHLYGPTTFDEFRGARAAALAVVNGDIVTSPSVTFASALPAPEPATWASLLIGFAALGATLRRRRYAARSRSFAS